MVFNNIVTNLIFNVGYMYSDVANYYKQEQASLFYWSNVGKLIGDICIRFLYKADFNAMFTFPIVNDCDLTDTTVICPETVIS